MECEGIEVEPSIFSGCGGMDDCPVCLGTSEVKVCPRCLEGEVEEDYYTLRCLLCDFEVSKV